MRFVADGETLVTGRGAEVEFLATAGLETLRRVAPPGTVTHQARAETVADVAFSPDGSRMVSVSWDGKWTIWDTATGRALLSLAAHEFGAHHVRFSADGRTLFTSGHDGAVRAWSAAERD